MRRKTEHIKQVLRCGCHGWLVIVEDIGHCYLWNALTLESIQLPSLVLDQRIFSCVSSSPSSPGNLESFILIFFCRSSSFIFCRVGDQQWTEQRITGSCDDNVCFRSNPACCNGNLYAIVGINGGEEKLLVMHLNPVDGRLVVCSHESIPLYKDHSDFFGSYMVESCGDIFMIYLLFGGKLFLEVTGVEVFKLDFSTMEWSQVRSFKDRAVLLDVTWAYSYRVVNPETEGNRIHFTWSDRSIYEFHVEENTLSVSLPNPDLKSPWCFPIWALAPTCTTTRLINPEHTKDTVPYPEGDDEAEANEAGLCRLPLDTLSSIASCLMLHDYINFRRLNRTCRMVAPSIRIRELAARNSLPPLLMFCKRGKEICKFTDPLRQVSYVMNNPNKLNDVRLCYSKQGWCLMVQSNAYPSMFLWNPFTKKIIPLPSSPYPNDAIIGCEFSSSPDSPDCAIRLVCYSAQYIFLDYLDVKRGTWENQSHIKWKALKLSSSNNLVYHEGDLCFLDSKGTLILCKPYPFMFEVQRPSGCESFYQSFLLEANGKLLAVFLGFMGKWVRVFELGHFAPVWVEVDDVGDQTLYVSHVASFASTATEEEMKNTICFPRLWGNDLVYYSLSSRKYFCYGSGVVIQDFYNTKELLYSGWIEPRW
ncbi:hypothetical protein V6N13_129372 [Hibiscus sabdariffa]|uniref:KIB1-4 beta-propeller domain-containing protein n=1 Tax=Hibiscus sabdariffa TaxID=183260 RepID=A0ABR2SL10_9ROSI